MKAKHRTKRIQRYRKMLGIIVLMLTITLIGVVVSATVLYKRKNACKTPDALSGIICITAVLGYGFGQETGTEASRMLLVGFILYILPVLSGWAVMWLETIKIRLMGD